MNKKLKSKMYFAFLLFAISFFISLRLIHLNSTLLWQDEADYALLAKSVAEDGVPTNKFNPPANIQIIEFEKNYDQLIKYKDVKYLNKNFHTYYPWVPFYFMALSYKLFDYSSASARYFQVLCSLISLFIIFLIIKENAEHSAAVWGLFYFSSNLFLIKVQRLSVHYSPAILLESLIMYLHFKYIKNKSLKLEMWITLVFIIYFYSQPVFFIMTFAIVSMVSIYEKDFRFLFKLCACLFMAIAPWVVWSNYTYYLKNVPLNSSLSFFNSFNNYYGLFREQFFLGLLFIIGLIFFLLMRKREVFLKNDKLNSYLLIWFFSFLLLVPFLAPWWLTPERCTSILVPLSIVMGLIASRVFIISKNNFIVFLLLVLPAVAFVDSRGRGTMHSTVGAIFNKSFDNGANWARGAIGFLREKKVKNNELIFSTMDNMSLTFYMNRPVYLAWVVDYQYLKKNKISFWYIDAPDKKSCEELTYLMKDKGNSICRNNYFTYNLLEIDCKKYHFNNFKIYFCPNNG